MTVDDTYGMIIPLIYLMEFDSTMIVTKVLCCLIYYAVVGPVVVLYDKEFEIAHGLPRSLLNQDYRNNDRLRSK